MTEFSPKLEALLDPSFPADPTDVTTGFGSSSGGSFVPVGTAKSTPAEQASQEPATNAPSNSSVADPNHKPRHRSSDEMPQGVSRYRSLSELGRGGWGFVVQARDEQLGRDVAIKQISGKLADREAVHKRFLHEARITGQLQHPGIVPVHELGIAEDGAPFYVMKLLEGETFKETITEIHRSDDSLPGGFSVQLLERFIDVCNAVAFAHQRNIIHRDLKPANIMVGRFGETIVVDWGLAKQLNLETDLATVPQADYAQFVEQPQQAPTLDATLGVGQSATPASSGHSASGRCNDSCSHTRHGTIFGTPAYMSPEQSLGEVDTLTAATDIYALGVILYELLTGENPFRSGDIQTTLSRVQAGEYRPPRAVKKMVPKALAAICTTAMARQPADRYASAEQIVSDIQRFLANEPVSVYDEPTWVKAIRWCKRRPALTAGILGSVVVLTISSLVFSAVIHRAHQAEHQARLDAEVAKQQALSRLAEARLAGDAWLVDLSGSLQFYPGMSGLRQQLLEDATEHYRRLESDLAKQPQPDEQTRLENARCHIRLGDLYRLLNQHSLSSHHYSDAEALLVEDEHDTTPNTGTPDSKLKTQQHVEAINARIGLALLAQSIKHTGKLKDLQTDAAWLRHELAACEQGVSLADPQHLASALARLQLAVTRRADTQAEENVPLLTEAEHWATYLISHRGDPRDHQLIQTIRDDLAANFESLGQLRNAQRVWSDEIHRINVLVDSRPNRPDLLQTRAFATMKYAGTLTQLGNSSEATNQYQAAARDLDDAWRLSDADAFYQRNTAISMANLGQLSADNRSEWETSEGYLVDAIDHLRRAVSIDGPTVSDLVKLAECYESLGNLANRSGKPDSIQRFDLAAQCYAVIEEHDALTPLINAKHAMMLTNRANSLLRLEQFAEAKTDYESANHLLAEALREPSWTTSQLAWIGRLELELMELNADLLTAEGKGDASRASRVLALTKLEALATNELGAPATEAFPQATLSLVDHLLEQLSATSDDYLKAAEWLARMKQTAPQVVESADWQQRHALAQWSLGNKKVAHIAITKADEIQPGNQLTQALRTTFQPSTIGRSDENASMPLSTLQNELPGDHRIQFWANQLEKRTAAKAE